MGGERRELCPAARDAASEIGRARWPRSPRRDRRIFSESGWGGSRRDPGSEPEGLAVRSTSLSPCGGFRRLVERGLDWRTRAKRPRLFFLPTRPPRGEMKGVATPSRLRRALRAGGRSGLGIGLRPGPVHFASIWFHQPWLRLALRGCAPSLVGTGAPDSSGRGPLELWIGLGPRPVLFSPRSRFPPIVAAAEPSRCCGSRRLAGRGGLRGGRSRFAGCWFPGGGASASHRGCDAKSRCGGRGGGRRRRCRGRWCGSG